MRREEVSHLLLSPQCAHDRGERQWGKNPLGLQAQCQERGEHVDQQRGVQSITLSWH